MNHHHKIHALITMDCSYKLHSTSIMHPKPNLSAAPQVCLRPMVGEIVPPQIWCKWLLAPALPFSGSVPPCIKIAFREVAVDDGTLCYSFTSILVKYSTRIADYLEKLGPIG